MCVSECERGVWENKWDSKGGRDAWIALHVSVSVAWEGKKAFKAFKVALRKTVGFQWSFLPLQTTILKHCVHLMTWNKFAEFQMIKTKDSTGKSSSGD